MTLDVQPENIQSFEQLTLELEMFEYRLASKLQIRPQTARRTLLTMGRAGTLDEEDELVERWQEAYAVYTDCLRWEYRNRPPPPCIEETEPRAADAALAVLCCADC